MTNSLNLPFVEGLYLDYKREPASVSDEWRQYFANLENGDGAADVKLGPSFRPTSLFRATEGGRGGVAGLQDRVDQLIRAYRFRGHRAASIDPLNRPRPIPPELDPAYYKFTDADLQRRFSTETMQLGVQLTLAEIVQRLRNTYCRSIGVEYMHIDDVPIRRWLQARMERTENRLTLTRDEQLRILTRLTYASVFEEFVRKKFIGAKSFSLEGSESLIPLLDLAIEKAGEQGVSEIVLGMAHRGRLNVLANILHKPTRQIFREFADSDFQHYTGRGDVKYHLGFSSDCETSSGNSIHLSLCFNPSHLEFVNAVALGRVRAKQDRVNDALGERGLTILIHGDAALAGEGVVQETLNMSQLPRLLGRRHAAHRRQQSDRIHDRTGGGTLDHLRDGCFQNASGADLSRERRRPRSGRAMRAARARFPRAVSARRGHRHVWLSPPRPQRGGRTGVHAADALPRDQRAEVGARRLSRSLAEARRRDARTGG